MYRYNSKEIILVFQSIYLKLGIFDRKKLPWKVYNHFERQVGNRIFLLNVARNLMFCCLIE